MKIDNKIRRLGSYRQFARLFKDGYYIKKETYTTGDNVYSVCKDWPDGTRSNRCYIAYDVAMALSKEFGLKIRKAKLICCALNYNPREHIPAPGHKITFHN